MYPSTFVLDNYWIYWIVTVFLNQVEGSDSIQVNSVTPQTSHEGFCGILVSQYDSWLAQLTR